MPSDFNIPLSMPSWNEQVTARPQEGLLSQQEALHRERVAQLEAARAAAAELPAGSFSYERLSDLIPPVENFAPPPLQNLIQQPQHIGGRTTSFIGGPPPIDKQMTLTKRFPQQVGADSYEHRMGVTQQPGLLVDQNNNAGLVGRPQPMPQPTLSDFQSGMTPDDIQNMLNIERMAGRQQITAPPDNSGLLSNIYSPPPSEEAIQEKFLQHPREPLVVPQGKQSRADRNNNPMAVNLRNNAGHLIPYEGLRKEQTDIKLASEKSKMGQFENKAMGLRAGVMNFKVQAKNLIESKHKDHKDKKSFFHLMKRYHGAKKSDVQSSNYATFVLQALGIDKDPKDVQAKDIDLGDNETMRTILGAISTWEGGNPNLGMTEEEIRHGIDLSSNRGVGAYQFGSSTGVIAESKGGFGLPWAKARQKADAPLQ